MKKITLAAMATILAIVPVFSALKADSGAWESIQAEAAWNYGDYRVERLAFSSDAVGPFSFGDAVFVAEPVDVCKLTPCDKYELYQLENGVKELVENVPVEALDAFRFALNDDRLVYVNQIDEAGTHFSVVERDLEDGSTDVLVEDVFFTGADNVDALVDEDDIYFETRLNFNDSTTVDQAAVYFWDKEESEADIIGTHWNLHDEHLLDAQDGYALEMLEFESGNKELWIGDTHNVNFNGMTREAVPGTWTESSGDIVAAHFLSDGSIEYFQYFTRHTYDPDQDGAPVRHESEHLSWYRPIEETYQMVGDRLAWIDESNNLFVSDDGEVTMIGQAGWGEFHLEEDRLFYGQNVEIAGTGASTTLAGKMYDFDTKTTVDTNYFVTDTSGSAQVGILPNTYQGIDYVYYMNTETGAEFYLGFGTNAVISDEDHVYWRGTDDNIYEATILPSAGNVQAMKTSASPVVYLIEDGVRKTIPSEAVYFSYFGSWADVQTVSTATLNTYPLSGKAKFAAGAKVKFTGSPKVYVVGEDGKLHWLLTQSVAYSIFGETWAQGIAEVTLADIVDYPIGDIIENESDVSLI